MDMVEIEKYRKIPGTTKIQALNSRMNSVIKMQKNI